MAVKRPDLNTEGQKELDKVEERIAQSIEPVESLKAIPVDRINNESALNEIRDYEPQTKISNREANRSDAIYLKPSRSIGCKAKFNEKFRAKWDHQKQYVRFIAENNEIIGEKIEIWTKPFAGVPYEFWEVPVNRPVMGPRHLAEQIATRTYRRLKMQEGTMTGTDGMGTYYGALQVAEVKHRLDARSVGNSFVSMAN